MQGNCTYLHPKGGQLVPLCRVLEVNMFVSRNETRCTAVAGACTTSGMATRLEVPRYVYCMLGCYATYAEDYDIQNLSRVSEGKHADASI